MTDSEPTTGAPVYDDPSLLDAYLTHRHTPVTSPNLVMEDPAFMAEAGDLSGLRILDLGCGDGTFARHCRRAGCASYTGVDGSAAMLDQARHGEPDPAMEFEHADLEHFEPAAGSFDLVTSRMALHYVEDVQPVFERAHDALVDGGRLVITVLHPVISAGNDEPSAGLRTTQIVDRYFSPGPTEREWFGRRVVWHHRTIEHYLSAMIAAGFTFGSLSECAPVEALFDGDRAEFERRRRVPLFLLLHGLKNT